MTMRFTVTITGGEYPAGVTRQAIENALGAEVFEPYAGDGVTVETLAPPKGEMNMAGKRLIWLDPVTDETAGVVWHQWTDGMGAVGFEAVHPDGRSTYVYLNPSSDSDDGVPNVFLYAGDAGRPDEDSALSHVDVFADGEPNRPQTPGTLEFNGVPFARENPETAARVILRALEGGGDVRNAFEVLAAGVGSLEALRLVREVSDEDTARRVHDIIYP